MIISFTASCLYGDRWNIVCSDYRCLRQDEVGSTVFSGGGLVTYNQRSGVSSDLFAKFLLYSGLITCVVGAFLVLLVNVLIGAVVIGCGLFDVALSFVIPTLRQRRS